MSILPTRGPSGTYNEPKSSEEQRERLRKAMEPLPFTDQDRTETEVWLLSPIGIWGKNVEKMIVAANERVQRYNDRKKRENQPSHPD